MAKALRKRPLRGAAAAAFASGMAHRRLLSYDVNTPNACPGCTQRNWLVGSLTAECAFCHTTLPLLHPRTTGIGPVQRRDHIQEARYERAIASWS